MIIWQPTLNEKSGFPQNVILGNLFSLLRISDFQEGWDRRERENTEKGIFKKAFTLSITVRILNRQEVLFQIHWWNL